MKKYRKKPVEIEAVQLNMDTAQDIFHWISKYTDGEMTIQPSPELGRESDIFIKIRTLEGTMLARKGDYIVKGVKDEIYPVRGDIFEETYEESHE